MFVLKIEEEQNQCLSHFIKVFRMWNHGLIVFSKQKDCSELKQSPDDGIVAWLTEITHSIGLLISSTVGLNLKAQLGEYGT